MANATRCAWCGASGVELTAGHITPVRAAPEPALDTANVAAACRSCQESWKVRATGPNLGVALDLRRIDVHVELEPGQDRVEPSALGGGGIRQHGAQDLVAIEERLGDLAGLAQHLETVAWNVRI